MIQNIINKQFKNLTFQERQRIAAIPKSIYADTYKYSHESVYREGVLATAAYGLARNKNHLMTFFGMQQIIQDMLSKPLTLDDVELMNGMFAIHFGDANVFNKEMWNKVVTECNGYLPIKIQALPEGIRVQGGITMYTVETFPEYPEFRQLASHVETILLHVWYPTTIATNDFKSYQVLKGLQAVSSDSVNSGFLVHDFGMRGVPTFENAGRGGLAHALYFDGSDNAAAVLNASMVYYNGGVTGFSVRASEHVVQTMFGPTSLDQEDYINRVISKWGTKNVIFSVVLDGYNLEREVRYVCSQAERIKKTGATFVCRPDSGDPLVLIPILLRELSQAFGTSVNSKGYKLLNSVRVLWGDGIDKDMIVELGNCLINNGYSVDNMVFGSGGGLLQKVNRDTYAFAQKGCAYALKNGKYKWYPMAKDPITDHGKKSVGGRRGVFVSRLTSEVIDVDIDEQEISDEWIPLLRDVYVYRPGMESPVIIDEPFDLIKERTRSIQPIKTYLEQMGLV